MFSQIWEGDDGFIFKSPLSFGLAFLSHTEQYGSVFLSQSDESLSGGWATASILIFVKGKPVTQQLHNHFYNEIHN